MGALPVVAARLLSSLLWLAIGLCSGAAHAAGDTAAAALRSQYRNLDAKLADSPFQRPLYLDSTEGDSEVKGDIYARMDYAFASVNAALNGSEAPQHWCEVMLLHLNTKYCRAEVTTAGATLQMRVGKKYEQPIEDAELLDFSYRVKAADADYFAVELAAPKGPLGTHDYRILLEATAVDGRRTFLHLSYGYRYGMAGRIALKSYLATAGSHKVGFTRDVQDGAAEYIGGVRGLVERNTMRYYLAIDAYLKTLAVAPDQLLERRLAAWFDATEQYPRQLHEIGRVDYLQMKRHEYQRQQSP